MLLTGLEKKQLCDAPERRMSWKRSVSVSGGDLGLSFSFGGDKVFKDEEDGFTRDSVYCTRKRKVKQFIEDGSDTHRQQTADNLRAAKRDVKYSDIIGK